MAATGSGGGKHALTTENVEKYHGALHGLLMPSSAGGKEVTLLSHHCESSLWYKLKLLVAAPLEVRAAFASMTIKVGEEEVDGVATLTALLRAACSEHALALSGHGESGLVATAARLRVADSTASTAWFLLQALASLPTSERLVEALLRTEDGSSVMGGAFLLPLIARPPRSDPAAPLQELDCIERLPASS